MPNIDLDAPHEGVQTATQRGVQWPDGTIVWGDPNDRNRVELPALAPYLGTPRTTFYLDQYSKTGAGMGIRSILKGHERMIEALHLTSPVPPRILERTLMLSAGLAQIVALEVEE
jgi:hypothetical protein